jgi:cytochrome c biogenesis protein CcdA
VLALLLLVVSIALADSVNPSTIVPALFYATGPRSRAAVAAFGLSVFAVSFAGGVLILLGGRELVESLLPDVGDRARHWLEVGAGALLIAVAAGVWLMAPRAEDRTPRAPGARRAWSAAALGAGIMLVELPTAFPYFAAIAAIAASDAALGAQLALVALYDALFVLPLAGILAARALAGERGDRLLGAMRGWTQRNAAAVLAATLAAVGVAILAVGVAGLA